MGKEYEALILLYECMQAFNEIEDTKLNTVETAKSTYELAARLSAFIKSYPYDRATVQEPGH
jgi:hypothetical protein